MHARSEGKQKERRERGKKERERHAEQQTGKQNKIKKAPAWVIATRSSDWHDMYVRASM
jgi:hypothetical protein